MCPRPASALLLLFSGAQGKFTATVKGRYVGSQVGAETKAAGVAAINRGGDFPSAIFF